MYFELPYEHFYFPLSNAFDRINPAKNPPICAEKAIFPPTGRLANCIRSQITMNRIPGMDIKRIKNGMGIKTTMIDFGKKIRYAPITAEIAPDAPIKGIVE